VRSDLILGRRRSGAQSLECARRLVAHALHAIERYAVDADGLWLDLTLTLDDPATLAKPLVVTKRWVRAPRARIAHHDYDVMSAGSTGVFAEYLDRDVEAALEAARCGGYMSPSGPRVT
jgi:hypothetical protein